ncbi:MAG: undecaprenyldiphospho-muramoylpentapeptide beta-N-acetylglucosaminyltransferase [Anaerolinea sp.]|nr:undecaprenyldiphospho-muramoylpentapeptide beta-N-acetylglucosaminyltransferase [Anaerolinea sp.]
MRLLICAGGTGGGVYPALAVLQALSKDNSHTLLWVGGEGGMEAALVTRQGLPYRAIPAAGIHGVGLRALPGNLLRLLRGTLAARRIVNEFSPDVLFFTGGYVAVPMALAAGRRPRLLYVPDIEPGLALKALARLASHIAITAPASQRYFNRRTPLTVTGYPTRADLANWTRATGRETFNIPQEAKLVLVFGGSKGARSINRALAAILPQLLNDAHVLHISGELDWPEVQAQQQSLPADLAARYHAFPYLHEQMGAALAAADLAVCRAGASTLGELPLFGLPAILVPYPYAWRYQSVNAAYLVEQGAARLVRDEALNTELLPGLQTLLQDAAQRQRMSKAMQALAHPQAAQTLADLLLQLAQASSQQSHPNARKG